ncbi:MAG: PAS domain S-box protein [Salinibacter sp.]
MSASDLALFSNLSGLSKRTTFWVLACIGALLAGALLFDAYADWMHQDAPPWSTLLENSIFTLLALVLPYVGWQLLRKRPGSTRLLEAAKWTVAGCAGTILLSGLVMGIHLLQRRIEPSIVVLQMAAIGALAGLWVGRSIARAKQTERQVQGDRDRLANLLEGLPAPVVHGRVEEDRHHIPNANAAFEETFGHKSGEIEGEDLYDLIVPEDRQGDAEELDRRALEEGFAEAEVRRPTTEGPRDFQLRVARALGEGSSETYATYMDITDHKKRQEDLRRQERRYQAVFQDPNILVALLGANGRVLDINQTAMEYIEASPEEVVGTPFWDTPWFDGDEARRDDAREWVQQASDGEYVEFEIDHSASVGQSLVVSGVARPVTDEEGTVTSLLFSGRDIAERKKRERELREREHQLEQILENATDVIWLSPADKSEIELVSDAYTDIWGRPTEQLKEHLDSFVEAIHPDDRDRVRAALETQKEVPEAYEETYRVVQPDGEVRWVRDRTGGVYDEDGRLKRIVGVATDITDRKRREHALRDRQEKIKALYEATEHLLTATTDEAVGERVHDLLTETFDIPLMGVSFVEDGTIVPCWIDMEEEYELPPAQPLEVEGESLGAQALRSGEIIVENDLPGVQNEIDYGDLQSAACVPIGERGVLYLGHVDTGCFDTFDLHLLDVLATHATVVFDRIEREEELLDAKKEAEEASRLKSAMLANMSHEIRTPLTSITGFAEILQDELEGRLEDFADRIRHGGKRLMKTLDSVLQVSQLEAGVHELEREEADLSRLAEETAEMLRPKAEAESVALTTCLPEERVEGHWNEEALNRIVENLLENAIKFTPEGGRVDLRVALENRTAVLEVEDTGIGMEPDEVDEFFEAFKQESEGLDRDFEGSGLGLSIVKRLTEELGGTVEVETQKGRGTCFAVRLPMTGGEEGRAV